MSKKKVLFPVLKLQLIAITFNLSTLVIYLPLYMQFGEEGIGWIAFYIIQLVVMVLCYRRIGKLFAKNYDNKILLINFIVSIIFSEIMVALVVYFSKFGGWIPISISNSFFTIVNNPLLTAFDKNNEIVFFRMSFFYIIEDIIRYLCLRSGKNKVSDN